MLARGDSEPRSPQTLRPVMWSAAALLPLFFVTPGTLLFLQGSIVERKFDGASSDTKILATSSNAVATQRRECK